VSLLKVENFQLEIFSRRKICVGQSHFTKFSFSENFPEWKWDFNNEEEITSEEELRTLEKMIIDHSQNDSFIFHGKRHG
jgi:hypothetical protein